MDFRWPFEGERKKLLLYVVAAVFILCIPIALIQGREYQATTTVYVNPNVARASTNTSDPAAQQVSIDTFISIATSPQTIADAAQASGLSENELSQALEAQAVGSTNSVSINVSANDPEAAGNAVTAVARGALLGYAQVSLDRLQGTLRYFSDQYDLATRDLNQYAASVDEAAPEEHYTAVQQRLIDITSGSSPGSAGPLQQELSRLQPIVLRFRELLAAQTQLGQIRQDAQARALELQGDIDSAGSIADASPVTVVEQSLIASVLRFALIGGLTAALFTAAVMYILRSIRELPGSSQHGTVAQAARAKDGVDAATTKLNRPVASDQRPSPTPRTAGRE